MRKIERISISCVDRERLDRLVRDRNTPQKLVWRARIVLLASEGATAEEVWIKESHSRAFAKASNDDRAMALQMLEHWVQGRRD